MNVTELGCRQVAPIIHGITKNIQHTPQAFRGDRYVQRRPGIINRHAPVQTLCPMQCDCPDMRLIQLLVHLEMKHFLTRLRVQRLVQRGQVLTGNHNNRSVDLGYITYWQTAVLLGYGL